MIVHQSGSPDTYTDLNKENSEELFFVANSDELVEIATRVGWSYAHITYSYSIERIGTDDHSALQSHATELRHGDEIDGNIAFANDKDLFEIAVSAAATYFLTIDLTHPNSLGGLQVELLQSDGSATSATCTRTSTQVTFEWAVLEDTSYFLEMGRDDDRSSYSFPQGDYTVSLAVEDLGTLRRGDDTDELFLGTDDAEVFVTLGGNDTVHPGKGADIVHLGDGSDVVFVGGGAEQFHGGAGQDRISYYDSLNGVNINLQTNEVSGSWASNDTISGFENVSGSKTGDDTITGTSGANTIKTYGGNDLIFAGDGDDRVYAGKGNDRVFLGDGDDYVVAGGGAESFDGGDGQDYISYRDSRAGVVIDLQANTASGSWAANDKIKNFENVAGSDTGSDIIFGTSGRNYLDGFGGNDTLYGRDGNDFLAGRDGNDELYGGAGNDLLWGGAGDNALIGGAGADTFDFHLDEYIGGQSSRSVIRDFENDVDTIRVYTTRSVGNDISDYAQQVGDDLLLEVNSEVSLMIWDMTLVALQDDVVFELV